MEMTRFARTGIPGCCSSAASFRHFPFGRSEKLLWNDGMAGIRYLTAEMGQHTYVIVYFFFFCCRCPRTWVQRPKCHWSRLGISDTPKPRSWITISTAKVRCAAKIPSVQKAITEKNKKKKEQKNRAVAFRASNRCPRRCIGVKLLHDPVKCDRAERRPSAPKVA